MSRPCAEDFLGVVIYEDIGVFILKLIGELVMVSERNYQKCQCASGL